MAMLAVVGMALVTDRVEENVESINISTSMRIHLNRIATLLVNVPEGSLQWSTSAGGKAQLRREIDDFSEKLQEFGILTAMEIARSAELNSAYQRIRTSWQVTHLPLLHQLLESSPTSAVRQPIVWVHMSNVWALVTDIDNMALLVRKNSKHRVYWIGVGVPKGVIILLSIGAILLAIFLIYAHFALPVRDLVQGIDRVDSGDYSYRIRDHGNSDLGELCKAYNFMAENLAEQHHKMVALMTKKTQKLQTSNELLEWLYCTSRRLLDNPHSPQLIVDVTDELVKFAELEHLSLCIYPTPEEGKYELIEPSSSKADINCNPSKCPNCWKMPENLEGSGRLHEMSVPIRDKGEELGFMYVVRPPDRPIDKYSSMLVKATADMLSVTLLLRKKEAQDKRLMLMEERSVIARELHDSLVQSLSYMKTQVTWLNSQMKRGSSVEELSSGVNKLQDALSSAYGELRALLTTFRLKIDKPTLHAALVDTVTEFEARSALAITLSFGLHHHLLTSNEDIHILQIVREALSNTVKHAEASMVNINCRPTGKNKVTVTISDDGVGITDNAENYNHYGMAIMDERARSLNGQIHIRCSEKGGTEIELLFTPQQMVNAVSAVSTTG
ncbi:MAG: histidine kinase [Porticoccus sp.]